MVTNYQCYFRLENAGLKTVTRSERMVERIRKHMRGALGEYTGNVGETPPGYRGGILGS